MIKRVECINGEMTDLRFCDSCDEEIPENHAWWGDESGDFCCLECYLKQNEEKLNETLTAQNAYLVGGYNPQKITVNELWAAVFTEGEIDDILYQHFLNLPKDKQTELIRKYAEEEPYYWLKILAESKDETAKKILEAKV